MNLYCNVQFEIFNLEGHHHSYWKFNTARLHCTLEVDNKLLLVLLRLYLHEKGKV